LTRTAASDARTLRSISAFTSALILAASDAAPSKRARGPVLIFSATILCVLFVPLCGLIIITEMKIASLLLLLALAFPLAAQSSHPIIAAVESHDWQTARSEINKLRNDPVFRERNYEYLLGRIAERTGDFASATANYQEIAANDSRLKQYALWRLAKLAR